MKELPIQPSFRPIVERILLHLLICYNVLQCVTICYSVLLPATMCSKVGLTLNYQPYGDSYTHLLHIYLREHYLKPR